MSCLPQGSFTALPQRKPPVPNRMTRTICFPVSSRSCETWRARDSRRIAGAGCRGKHLHDPTIDRHSSSRIFLGVGVPCLQTCPTESVHAFTRFFYPPTDNG